MMFYLSILFCFFVILSYELCYINCIYYVTFLDYNKENNSNNGYLQYCEIFSHTLIKCCSYLANVIPHPLYEFIQSNPLTMEESIDQYLRTINI